MRADSFAPVSRTASDLLAQFLGTQGSSQRMGGLLLDVKQQVREPGPAFAFHALHRFIFVSSQHDRQLDNDPSPLADGAIDGGLAAEQSGSFPDTGQSELAFFNIFRPEPDASILDLDPKLVAMLHQFYPDLLALTVLARIRQGFLGNAVHGILQDGSQPLELDPAPVLDLWPLLAVAPRPPNGQCAATMPSSSRIGGLKPLISRRASKWPCRSMVTPAS